MLPGNGCVVLRCFALATKRVGGVARACCGYHATTPLLQQQTEQMAKTTHGGNYVLPSKLANLDIPNVSLPDFLWRRLDSWSDRVLVECGTTGRKITYGELKTKTENLARSLRNPRMQLHNNDAVAILLPNVPEYFTVLIGTIQAGLIATTVNPIYTSDEIARQLKDSSAKLIFTLNELFPTAQEAVQKAGGGIKIVTIKNQKDQLHPNGAIKLDELCTPQEGPVPQPTSPQDIAIMPYSSGTTGLPKGVELTHKNIVANILQFNAPGLNLGPPSADFIDIVPAVLPFFHIYGMTGLLFNAFTHGNKVVTLPKFTPESYLALLVQHKPTFLMVVPPIILFMASHPAVKPEYLEAARIIMSGAAPLGAADTERFAKKCTHAPAIIQGFGMTETSPVICLTPKDTWQEAIGSVGWVVPNTDIKVVALDNEESGGGSGAGLGPNQPGELLVRGPQVMHRYHNNAAATAEIFTPDGFLKTGDMARYTEDGIVFITDRLKELIKVKGFQVAPAELEEIIRTHPAVADAAVIGQPHPAYGEVPKAVVVPKAGVDFRPQQLQDFVAEKVAPYKKLEGGVVVVEAIPKNQSGKILRRNLKEMFASK